MKMRDECAICGGKCCKVAYFECSENQKRFICMTRPAAPVEDGVLVHSRCHHLTEDNSCGCYDLRPQACRRWDVNGVGCNIVRGAFENGN